MHHSVFIKVNNVLSLVDQTKNKKPSIYNFPGDTEIHGQYECGAENEFGQARATIEVSGKATPAQFKSSRMGEKKRPTEFSLEWAVSSYTPVTQFRCNSLSTRNCITNNKDKKTFYLSFLSFSGLRSGRTPRALWVPGCL